MNINPSKCSPTATFLTITMSLLLLSMATEALAVDQLVYAFVSN